MGWFDNLWRRRQDRTNETQEDTARARTGEEETRRPDKKDADVLEEDAHRFRDEEIYREPRIPPGTG